MANQVTLTFAGDSRSLERTFSNVGSGANEMAADLDRAEGKVKGFGSGLDSAADIADRSESKFMGTADVLDGLGAAFGLPLGKATEMSRAFGDLTGGFATLGPSIGGVGTAFSSIASGPMAVWLAVGAAVAGAIVLLWQNSETFRDIVTGAFNAVKSVVGPIIEGIGKAFGWLGGIFGDSGDDAEDLADKHEEAGQRLAAAYEEAMGKVTTVLDGMADPFERFNHEQTLTLDEATANLQNNVAEYQKWADDIRVIRERFGEDTAQFVIDQGDKFHGVADQLANSTDEMGASFDRQVGQLNLIKGSVSDTASGWEEAFGIMRNTVLSLPDMLGGIVNSSRMGPDARNASFAMPAGAGVAPSYTINVQAWDGRDAGAKVVGAIKQYESANGTSWRAR